MDIALRRTLAASVTAALAFILVSAFATPTAAQQVPSFAISGSGLNDLEVAFNVSRFRNEVGSSLSATNDFIVELRRTTHATEIMFAGTISGTSEFISVRSGHASKIPNFSQERLAVPVVLPGITVLELLAVLDYARVHDKLYSKRWFADKEYGARLYIGSAMLVATFAPPVAPPQPEEAMQCVSGCTASISYHLKVDSGRFIVRRVRIL
jgi:hypothetical protein